MEDGVGVDTSSFPGRDFFLLFCAGSPPSGGVDFRLDSLFGGGPMACPEGLMSSDLSRDIGWRETPMGVRVRGIMASKTGSRCVGNWLPRLATTAFQSCIESFKTPSLRSSRMFWNISCKALLSIHPFESWLWMSRKVMSARRTAARTLVMVCRRKGKSRGTSSWNDCVGS